VGDLLGQALHLRRERRKSLAVLAGSRRLDRCVEREQVGLSGDGPDQRDDLADPLRGAARRSTVSFAGWRAVQPVVRLCHRKRWVWGRPGGMPRKGRRRGIRPRGA
jgi:hypothetical protein